MSRIDDVIEREIRIAARPETIFPFFIDPEKMIQWKGIEATLDPQPGGTYQIKLNETEIIQGQYVEIVPYSRIVFSWGWLGEDHPLPPGNSTVEFTFRADGDETIVRLRHSGVPSSLLQGHEQGWDYFLRRLVEAAKGHDSNASS